MTCKIPQRADYGIHENLIGQLMMPSSGILEY